MNEVSIERIIPKLTPDIKVIPGESAHVWDDSWIMRSLPEQTVAPAEDELSTDAVQEVGNLATKKVREEWS